MKSKWLFSLLWINGAVLLVVLILMAANQISGVRGVFHVLAYSLVYANITGVLAVLAMGPIAEKAAARHFSPVSVAAGGVIVFTGLGCLLAQTLLMATGTVVPQHFWWEYLRTLRFAMPLAIVFGLGAASHGALRERVSQMEKKLHEQEVSEERANKLAAEARLRSLESRIQPHFLFNTLNSISSLIAVNPARAEQMVGRLAVLLRASLDTTQQPLIPLRQELAMVESYLDIEKARFGDGLRGVVRVPDDLQDAQVPPMSVQSLVENALKHGITPRSGGGEVVVTASSEDSSLHIQVRDSGPGFELTSIRAGHGLDNLVQRLDALFGAKASLNVLRQDGEVVVEMVLPRV